MWWFSPCDLPKGVLGNFPGLFQMCELQRGAKLLKEIKMRKGKVFHVSDPGQLLKSKMVSYAGRKMLAICGVSDISKKNGKIRRERKKMPLESQASGYIHAEFDQVVSEGAFMPLKEKL